MVYRKQCRHRSDPDRWNSLVSTVLCVVLGKWTLCLSFCEGRSGTLIHVKGCCDRTRKF
jgi:hypothetical protein